MHGTIGAARLAVLAALAVGIACSEGAVTQLREGALPDDARFSGTIVNGLGEAPAEDALGGIWISTVPGSTDHEHQIGLVVWPSTDIVVHDADGSYHAGTVADLEVGSSIRVWTTEAEYFSIPPQYDATRIELDPASG